MASAVEKYVAFCYTPFGRQLIDTESEFLKAELAGSNRILDIGCGIGAFEQRMSDFNIIGIDIDGKMLSVARTRAPHANFHRADASRLPFLDSSYDAAFLAACLEFMEDYRLAIDETARVLELNGKLIAMVLNPISYYFKSHYEREDSYFRRIKHQNPSEISDYVGKFFDVSTHYFLGVDSERIFDTYDIRYASLYAITGTKRTNRSCLKQDNLR